MNREFVNIKNSYGTNSKRLPLKSAQKFNIHEVKKQQPYEKFNGSGETFLSVSRKHLRFLLILSKHVPPISQYSLSPTLQQLIELQLELFSLWLFKVRPWTVYINYSECFLLFVLTPERAKQVKKMLVEYFPYKKSFERLFYS